MTIMPFICLGIGFFVGVKNRSIWVLGMVDQVINVVLVILMLTIGLNIGINDSVMSNLGVIGLNCVIISCSGILLSVACVFVLEETVLPLQQIKEEIMREKLSAGVEEAERADSKEEKKPSPLIVIMPVSIVAGVALGYFLFSKEGSFSIAPYLDWSLLGSLVLLYTGVGISLGTNRSVFRFVKRIGFKLLLLPLGIFVGSLGAGVLTGLILGIPQEFSLMSAGGMSYYSVTGAYMTNAYGIEAGTYGFMVNVMREFFTVVFLPLLIRISKGSPIAAGAAGGMDTMLMPITRLVGPELGLVTLITGSILTIVVPILLPIVHGLL
ncbi:MAG: lysine exporter LysO family protein [Anaerovoracaceae bacterium]